MYTDYALQQQQMNNLPFMQGPLDPALLQDYINSQNLQIQDPSLRQQSVQQPAQQPRQGVQLAGPMVPGALPNQQPNQPQPQVQQSQPPVAQPQPPVQQPQPGSAEYMNQEAQNVSNPMPDHANTYGQIQQDPTALLNYAKDSNVPEHFRTQAITRAGDLLSQNKAKNEAIQKVATMDPNSLANALKERTTNGSWTKAIIYGLLGMHNMAQDEAAKLGIGKDTPIIGSDGKAYLIKMAANGTPLEGFSSETGKKLTSSELVDVAANGTMQKGRETHTGKMQDVTTKEIYYEQTTPNGIRLVSPSGKTYTGSTANLRAYGIGSDIDTKNQIQLNELQNKLAYVAPTEKSKVIAQHEATYGPLDPATRAKLLQGQPLPPVVGTVGQTVPQSAMQPQPTMQQGQNMPVATNAQKQPLPTSVIPSTLPQSAPSLPTVNAQGKVTGPAIPSGLGGGSPAAVQANLDLQKKQQEANIEQQKQINVAELKPPAEEKGKEAAKDIKNQYYANETYSLIKPLAEEIKKSTGSGIGTSVDKLASKFGVGTSGAQSIAKLDVLGYQLSSNVPRFEGSQSDADVRLYKQAAGDLANSEKPIAVRLAALQAITQVLAKYDKANKNDWTFGEKKPAGTEGVTSSGNKFKRVQ